MCRLLTNAAVVVFSISFSFAQAPCDLKKDADGIRVYTCKTENEKLKSLRAEFELKEVTFEELKKFIWNVNNYKTWQYNLLESESVGTAGTNEMSYRLVVDAPWPVENREITAHIKTAFTPPVSHLYIHSFEYELPVPAGLVRVPLFEASWQVEETGRSLKVVYSLRIDPGGSVPAWLANIALAEGPFTSFRKLKRQLEEKNKIE